MVLLRTDLKIWRKCSVSRLTLTASMRRAVTIRVVDPAGDPLPGACFRILIGKRPLTLCDGPTDPLTGPGDGRADGIVVLTDAAGLQLGTFQLVQTHAPDGYLPAAAQGVAITDGPTLLTVTNGP